MSQYKLYESNEYNKLIASFVRLRDEIGSREPTEEEIVQMIRFCETVRIQSICIGMVLKGKLFIDFDGKECLFKITPEMKKEMDNDTLTQLTNMWNLSDKGRPEG